MLLHWIDVLNLSHSGGPATTAIARVALNNSGLMSFLAGINDLESSRRLFLLFNLGIFPHLFKNRP